MESLDELDCGIIALLQEDARMSSRAMTHRLGHVSDRVVRYRVRRLLDRSVVFLQAVVNPRRVGYPVIADILLDVMPERLAEVSARLVGLQAVAAVSASPAGRQLSIQVNTQREEQLAAFVGRTLPQIDGILHSHAMAVPLLVKDLALWRPPEVSAFIEARAHLPADPMPVGREQLGPPREARDPGAEAGWHLDDLDRQIVTLLREDPRMSSREMTQRLGDISDRVVRYRVKRLLDRRVVLLQARVNPHEVGYPVVADALIEVVPWKHAAVCATLAVMDPVCYMSTAHTGRDSHELSIEINARHEDELAMFVGKTLPKVDGIVRARTVVVPRLVKDVALWEIPR